VSVGPAPCDSTEAHGDAPAAPLACPVSVVVPLALRALGNRREHHLARARRTRREIGAVLAALESYEPPPLEGGVVVVLVRVAWNRCDVDGLVASMKAPIDAIASWLRVDDRDARVRWHLAQSITRAKRNAATGRMKGYDVPAAELRVVIRAWRRRDGTDPLRVLAAAPREVRS
jgi:hypothetical protein